MSAAAPCLAEIDAAIIKGEWWMTLFDALSDAGMKQVMALKSPKGRGLAGVAEAFCRLALAVRLAIAAAMRLDVLLQGLADLRRLAPEAIAAAKARIKARVEEAAAGRAKARDAARAKRQARMRESALASSQGETQKGESSDPDAEVLRDHDPEVEALERALDVDPAGVDFDALPLRQTVERICAALGLTPNWRQWEAGDWTMGEPRRCLRVDRPRLAPARPPRPPSHSPMASLPNPFGPRRFTFPIPALPGLPTLPSLAGLNLRRPDTAIGLALAAQAGSNAPPWPPRPLE